MIRLFGPAWFLGVDELLDIFSIIASFLIVLYGWRVYRATQQKNIQTFSFAFFFIGISFLLKVFTNYMLYQEKLAYVSCILCNITNIDTVYIIGYFFYRLFFLLALIILFALALHIADKRILFVISSLTFLLTFLSNYQYFIFHIAATLFLFFITAGFYKNYCKLQTKNCLLVYESFFFIFLSQLFFIFVLFSPSFYVVGEIIQLLGYILLIWNHLLILRK